MVPFPRSHATSFLIRRTTIFAITPPAALCVPASFFLLRGVVTPAIFTVFLFLIILIFFHFLCWIICFRLALVTLGLSRELALRRSGNSHVQVLQGLNIVFFFIVSGLCYFSILADGLWLTDQPE